MSDSRSRIRRHGRFACAVAGIALMTGPLARPAFAQVTAFKQAVAETASAYSELAAFYRSNGYQPIWVGDDEDDRARRAALLAAVETAPIHGLPAGRYDADTLRDLMGSARNERDRGRVEVELSRAFLRFAGDLDSGVVTPGRVASGIKREVARRDAAEMLAGLTTQPPAAFLRSLAPRSAEYTRLIGEKAALERVIAAGGWGPAIRADKLTRGARGEQVIALRDRLHRMGYLGRSATDTYDSEIVLAVTAFQKDNGLSDDGVAGEATLSALNLSANDRLGLILVAMERERWLSDELGERFVWVNLTDFRARIIDQGEITFETRSVIGKDEEGRETPEFSDVMEYMVINPTWYVPRSITVNEYLPQLRRNPNALSHMKIVDRNGREVSRRSGFSQYSASSFPFYIRQPPSDDNALGLVKFMFPNKYNIYLHDTPAKSLFGRDIRAFSHGCVRLNDPFDFAYALLSKQEDDPKAYFQRVLRSGRETRVTLDTPMPVHLVYRTAYTKPTGGMEYRADIYGRDAKILDALRRAGVALADVQG